MCMQPSDERVQAIVTAEYGTMKGIPRGAYETVDDAFVLVNVNVFDRLVYNAELVVEENNTNGVLTYEEVKEQFGDRIIQEYLASQVGEGKQEVETRKSKSKEDKKQSKLKNLDKANVVKTRYADAKRKEVLRLLLKGCSASEITSILGYSSSVVYKAFKSFEHDFVYACYNNDFVKEGIIKQSDFMKFVNLNYDYKRFLEYSKSKFQKLKSEAVVKKKEIVVEEVQENSWGTASEEDTIIRPNVVSVVKVDNNDELAAIYLRDRRAEVEVRLNELSQEEYEYYTRNRKLPKQKDTSLFSSLGKAPVKEVADKKKVVPVPSSVSIEIEEYTGEVDEWGMQI